MELRPHDLLQINAADDVICHASLPEWTEASIQAAPFVVVRRARSGPGLVAVGIRGSKRSERFAAFLPIDRIITKITPEQLAAKRNWRKYDKEIFYHLEEVARIMDLYSLEWGIAGSIGFELASGKETTTKTSDIDIVIRFHPHFKPEQAKEIKNKFKKMKTRVDVQIETVNGAFSLSEYASCGESPILFRTMDGPVLKKV